MMDAVRSACLELDFPAVTPYRKHIGIHYLDDIKAKLGSPDDDFENFFTARMLLLLEGRPVHGEGVFDDIARQIIDTYFRDYHNHSDAFKPLFLANDILRYWKTLCLNYEHRRNRPATDPQKKNENHLANLKLKFSRLLICFSTILVLSKHPVVVSPDRLYELVHRPPLERLREAAKDVEGGDALLARILAEYAWFLEMTGRPIREVLDWIGDKGRRYEAFDHAKAFGADIYELLCRVTAGTDTLRYLVM